MPQVDTVKVIDKESKTEMVINKEDFDPRLHEKKKPTREQLETEESGEVTEEKGKGKKKSKKEE